MFEVLGINPTSDKNFVKFSFVINILIMPNAMLFKFMYLIYCMAYSDQFSGYQDINYVQHLYTLTQSSCSFIYFRWGFMAQWQTEAQAKLLHPTSTSKQNKMFWNTTCVIMLKIHGKKILLIQIQCVNTRSKSVLILQGIITDIEFVLISHILSYKNQFICGLSVNKFFLWC